MISFGFSSLQQASPQSGLTLAQFKAKVKPSFDARDTIAALDHQMAAAVDQRDDAVTETARLSTLVVNSVKSGPAFGEDSELYEAMGYVRKSGLTRKKPASASAEWASPLPWFPGASQPSGRPADGQWVLTAV